MPVWAMTVPHADPAMPQPQAVDEPDVEDDVEAEPADRGDERGAGVLQAAQHAGRREDDEHRRDADRRDPQVGHGLVERGRRRRRRRRQTGSAASRATTAAVTAPRAIASQVPSMPAEIAPGARAGAELAGDDGGRAVGEEDEDVRRGEQHGARDAEARRARATPRRPTIAASARRNSGSATRARKAGTARRSTSRCWPRLLASVTTALCHGTRRCRSGAGWGPGHPARHGPRRHPAKSGALRRVRAVYGPDSARTS